MFHNLECDAVRNLLEKINISNFYVFHSALLRKRVESFYLKSGFWQYCNFTKYRCCNASKWPQMHQKWIITIPVGSGHTLDTLNHGLESLFYCFITHFGAGGSLDPPGAPWRPPGPPGAPLTPGMSSWAIVSHPGTSWVIFDPSGVNNWGVYTTVHCTALHNALFVQYLLLATEQVGSYFKSCVLVYHLTYIYPNSFGCEQNSFVNFFVSFKL